MVKLSKLKKAKKPKKPKASPPASKSAAPIDQAVNLVNQQHWAEALRELETLKETYPQDAEVWHLIGVVNCQTQHIDEAIVSIEQAIKLQPEMAHFYANLGNAYKAKGDLDQAIHQYQQALKKVPDFPDALFNLGNTYCLQGAFHQAIKLYEKVIQIQPDYLPVYFNLANAKKDAGEYQAAIPIYEEAIKRQPNHANALCNLAITYQALKQYPQALEAIQQSIQLNPNNESIYCNLGNILQDVLQVEEAFKAYDKAIELNPHSDAAYYNKGVYLGRLGAYDEAISVYQKALAVNPNNLDTLNNLANLYHIQQQFDEAIVIYKKIIEIAPNYYLAYYNLGLVYQDLLDREKAIQAFNQCLAVEPDYYPAVSALYHQYSAQCDWDKLTSLSLKLEQGNQEALSKGIKTPESPFSQLMRIDAVKQHYEVAKSWSQQIEKDYQSYQPFSHTRKAKDKIRIGYLSSDFYNHATLHLMQDLFHLHNRDKFEVISYSYGRTDESEYRRIIEEDSDVFKNLSLSSVKEIAEEIYQDKIDILVDLKGYTQNGRLEILALRPAPIQVTYLGFPGTSGANFIDYAVVDKVVVPEEHYAYYSEKLVLMPDCYQINPAKQVMSTEVVSRQEYHLPDKAIVFCSFNQALKVEPVVFSTWMTIMKQVPNSVLWLLEENESAKKHLRHFAAQQGVESERLIFAPKEPKSKHIKRLSLADLVLDTHIYNGHTTTSDALWAGLPVVTWCGEHFAARVSASLLKAMGLPELVTHSKQQFIEIAIDLAKHPSKIDKIKEKLRQNQKIYPLFKPEVFTRHLENAYQMMWGKYLNHEKPEHLWVKNYE